MAISIEDLYNQKSQIDSMTFECAESHKRLKISRGYYATYLAAEKLVESNGTIKRLYYPPKSNNPKNKYGSHQQISWSLIYSDSPILKDIGQKLIKYHTLRKKADYDIHLDITEEEFLLAETYLNQCKELIEHYNKKGNVPFSRAKKVIVADIDSGGNVQIKNKRGLRVIK